MDLYPLDLVLATTLAWATIFLAALPTRLLRLHYFTRLAAYNGLAWLIVASLVPPAITHYYTFLGLIYLYAWWQLRHDNALRAKVWLISAAGLGISLGVVLILAETPDACPAGISISELAVQLAAIYLGAAIPGVAAVLYFFTRREATQIGMPAGTVRRYANAVVAISIASGLISLFLVLAAPQMNSATVNEEQEFFSPTLALWTKDSALLLSIVLVPLLAFVARGFALSPAPSRSGPSLIAVASLATITEILFRLIP